MITIISGGGGHARLALGIAEVLKELKINFNVFHTGSKLENEWFQNYENYPILRPTRPMERIKPKELIVAYKKVLRQSKKIGRIIISSGASLSFVVSTVGKLKGSKIINFEVPDRIRYHSQTFSLLSKISWVDIVSWREQKIKESTEVLNGVILPKPLVKPKKGKYVLISTGTTQIGANTIQRIVDKVISIGEKAKVLYHGKGQIKNAEVIKEYLHQKEVEKLIANAKLVISHPGYTAFESAINYKKPVILIVPEEYKKGPKKEDAMLLSKKLNLSCCNISKKAISRLPKEKCANKKFKKIIIELMKQTG